jgi:hypothetical protein
MSFQTLIGFRRRLCGLLNEQRRQFLDRHLSRCHGSPFRPDGAAEGVAHGGSSVLRPDQGRSCDLWVGRRVSASVMVFHGICSPIGLFYVALPYIEASSRLDGIEMQSSRQNQRGCDRQSTRAAAIFFLTNRLSLVYSMPEAN